MLDWELPLYEQLSVRVARTPVRVDRVLDDGDVLEFGGGALAIASPGHTPGSVALYLSAPNVLFTGDAVARAPDGSVILGVFNVAPKQAARTFDRLAKLNAAVVCFGHGVPLTEDPSHVEDGRTAMPPLRVRKSRSDTRRSGGTSAVAR